MNDTVTAGNASQIKNEQESLILRVCEFYGRQYAPDDKSRPSIRDAAAKFNISAMKVKKILITGGLFQTEETDEIQQLYATGYSVKQIAEMKNMTSSNVNACLPYGKSIYGLDVRNKDAIRVMMWRKELKNRVTGKPSDRLKADFDQAIKNFSSMFDKPLNIRLAACNIDNGPQVLIHFLRYYSFAANIPKNIPIEQYIKNIDGHAFMYGHDDLDSVDGILIMEDNTTDYKQTILRLLASIYCRHYETKEGHFFQKFCTEGDSLEQKIMKTGYAVWSDYITMHMTEKVLGEECFCDGVGTYELSMAVKDVVVSGSTASLAWVLLCMTGENKADQLSQLDAVCKKGKADKFAFSGSLALLNSKGFNISIDRAFIRKLGKTILIELQEAQIKAMKAR